MDSAKREVGTLRNERVVLTSVEREVVDSLDGATMAPPIDLEGADAVADARKAIARETRDVLARLIPDFQERAGAGADQLGSAFAKLKGTAWPTAAHARSDVAYLSPASTIGDLLGGSPPAVVLPTQPAHAGELWWSETSWFMNAPPNTLNVDINASDRYRIWGHIGYGADNTLNGTVGLVMTFILSPDRYPRTGSNTFEVRPELRTGGWVSGWTGQYHPLWHADDKWSKCWRVYRATLTLSSGETLAGDELAQNLFFLDNVNPVGQASVSEFQGWTPILRFGADIADLRRRGISMIFRAELRYDFQLEGESDIWFRNRPGSASESVPAFDNAVDFRCWPGTVSPL
jgi:hypothetical protein